MDQDKEILAMFVAVQQAELAAFLRHVVKEPEQEAKAAALAARLREK